MKIILASVTLASGYLLLGPGSLVLAAIFLLVSHFAHHRAGLLAALTAATAPAFYAHDPGWAQVASPTLSVSALAFAALGSGTKRARTVAAIGGLLAAAFGFIEGGQSPFDAALPALGVGFTWALTRPERSRAPLILCGAAFVVSAYATLPTLERHAEITASTSRTFDFTLIEIARGLYPWSALLPFALGAMTVLPPAPEIGVTPGQTERQSALRVLLLTGTILSYVGSQLPSRRANPELFSGLVFGAAAIGLWLTDISRGTRIGASSTLAIAALAAVIGLDFLRFPEKRASVFAPDAAPDVLAKLTALEASPPLALSAAVALPAVSALVGCLWQQRGALRAVPLLGTVLSAIILRWIYFPQTPARLDAREVSAKFLDSVLIDELPAGARPLDAEFGGRLRAVGWELLDGVLPCRDERRLPVTRGAHDHQRVRVGTLAVR